MRKGYVWISFLILNLAWIFPTNSWAQCGPGTPTVNVDLTGNPGGTWISPIIVRNDNCCGTSAPDKCVKFVVTLDPNAVGISFNIASGAVPPGALFYQINCGPPTPVGSPICLSGPGPHIITFCKPGNNSNTYSITSIPAATGGNDITINDGCSSSFNVTGMVTSSITWNSISPGAPGQYNSYLSCTSGCSNPTVTPQAGFPPFVDYVVCGTPLAVCSFPTVCDTVRVTFNPSLGVSIIPIDPTICFGQATTSLTAVGSGGTPPYTFTWNTGATTATINAGVGTFSVIMGDQSGCPPTNASVTVTQFANPITANAGPDVTVCALSPNVTLSGSVTGVSTGIWTGGNGGVFSPSATSLNATYIPSAADLAAGSVTLTLTTTNNGSCPGASDQMIITYHNFNSTIAVTPTHVLCGGQSTGSANAIVTGTFSPYTYSWNTSPVQTTSTASSLPAGTYTVTVTDNTGCTGTQSVTITQPFPLSSNTTQDNVLCNGGASGSASVGVFGGTLPYSYLWSPGGNTTANPGSLSNGTYIVTITDGNGCIHHDTVTISQPLPLSINATGTNVSCFNGNNGTATANVSGGTAPYAYLWSPGGSTSSTASGLMVGTYSVQVTDANGCTISASTTITQPLQLSSTVTSTNPLCNGGSTGTASVTASGGTAPYSYSWSPGGQTTSSVSGLAAGSYTVTITDANGCQNLNSVILTNPPVLSATSAGVFPVSCFGGNDGSGAIAVSGGTPSYTYSWSPSGGSAASATNLAAGTYTVTTSDANACTATVSITITQPATALSAITNVTDAACFGTNTGSIDALPSGGTSPYTIQWFPSGNSGITETDLYAGIYNYSVTDANGCEFNGSAIVSEPTDFNFIVNAVNSTCGNANGSGSVTVSGATAPYSYLWSPSGGNNSSASGLLAASYFVIVTDNVGCQDTAVVNISDASSPVINIGSVTNVSCFGGNNGSATVNILGGAAPFSVLWNTTGSTNSTVNNLFASIHTVTVTDANGCDANASVIITEPTPLVVSATQDSVSCFGGSNGSATAFAGGATPGYTYSWSPIADNDNLLSNVAAGNYTVTVTDNNGCTATSSIAVLQPTPVNVQITSSTNVFCFGENNGTGVANASGGSPGYFYSWSNAASGASVTGLFAGTYTVTATDIHSCTGTNTLTITQPATAVSLSFNVTNASCFGSSNGSAQAVPSGGTPGYTFLWSNSSTQQTATSLAAGNYTCTVSDALGCQVNGIATIHEPGVMSVSIATQNSICGQSNGMALAQVNGGNGSYTYIWTPGNSTNSVLQNVPTGNYSVTVTDFLGCTATATSLVVETPGPNVSIINSSDATCFGYNNGSATASVSSGTGPFQYSWIPQGGNAATGTGMPAGVYSVLITDANGCQTSTATTISQPAAVNPVLGSLQNVSCFGLSDGSITVNTTGGTGAYSYAWSPSGGNSSTANGLAAGNYHVIVTDINGCTGTFSGIVSQPSTLTLSVLNSNNPICFGSSNGSINVNAGGGTPNYQYSWNTIPVQSNPTAVGLAMGTYTATVTDGNGCTATVSQSLSQPTDVVTVVSPNDTICGGQSTTLTANASGGNAPYFYSWSNGLSNSSSQVVSPIADQTFTVQVFDNNGCPGNIASTNIVVYYLDVNNLIVQANSPICPGSTSTVFATVNANNTGVLNYSWNQGLGTGPGAFSVTPTIPTVYTVTVSNSCGLTATDSVLVDMNPQPSVIIGSDLISGCVPLTVGFIDNSLTNTSDSIYSWVWVFGDGTGDTISDPVHTYNSIGTFFVTLEVTTWGGCNAVSGSNAYPIVVNPIPNAAFAVNSSLLNIPYETLVCDNNSSGATSYSWTFGDGTSSTAVNPTHIYEDLGTFPVTLIATNNFSCTDTAILFVTTTSDIVFPNAFTPNSGGPNGGTYNYGDLTNDVFFPYTAGIEDFHLLIFNRWGELIFESFDLKKGWDGYYRGELCQEGVYVWKVDCTFQDGRKFNKVGDVTLLR